MIIDWVFAFIILVYCLLIIYLWLGWENIEVAEDAEYFPSVAIIVPVRNEECSIELVLKDLQLQAYKGSLEVLIVDDHSEDATNSLVINEIEGIHNFRILELKKNEGKKAAIALGVTETNAEIIFTTDGDCHLKPNWVQTMIGYFGENVQLVSGPVSLIEKKGMFNQMQRIEFASLIGSGASLIGWGRPVMGNGANLAFRKTAFMEVGGFDGNEQTASGDDVFLIHKIARKYSNSVVFAKDENVLVETTPQSNLRAFWQQRKRWASKWKAYSDAFTIGTAVLVFLMSLSLALLPILAALGVVSLFTWLNLLVAKAFFDFFFIRQILRFSGSKMSLFAFIILQLLYPYYVVFTALFSLGNTYTWKGRKVK